MDWKPLADLTAAELRELAVEYRRMASVATQALPARALRELAERYERMAGERDETST
jgi:hypothetical protein